MTRRPIVLMAFITCCTAGLIAGCDRQKQPSAGSNNQTALELEDELIGTYQQACKDGNADQARHALLGVANLNERLTPDQKAGMTSEGPAGNSFAAYGLLYCLDKKIGNDELAEADLIKARAACPFL